MNLIEVAESFGVSEKTVEDWIHNNALPCVPDRGRLLFDRARVADWADAHGLTAKTGFLAPEGNVFSQNLELGELLKHGGIWREVAPERVLGLFEEIFTALPGISPSVKTLLKQRLYAPGGINWAPIGEGFALPHFSTRVTLGHDTGILALLFLKAPLPLEEPTPDGKPVTHLFFFIPPSPRAHLGILARLNRLILQGSLLKLKDQRAPDAEWFTAFRALDDADLYKSSERS